MRYYTDGSSTIGIKSAYVVTDANGKVLETKETVANRMFDVDLTKRTRNGVISSTEYTNNEEEYRAVIAALKICKDGDEVLTDSQLVVNQINGLFKVKKQHLLTLRNEAKALADLKQVLIRWIPREENKAGEYFE